MELKRRGFLKFLGVTATAVVAAPVVNELTPRSSSYNRTHPTAVGDVLREPMDIKINVHNSNPHGITKTWTGFI